jgi:iron complex outermembrane receptor protein
MDQETALSFEASARFDNGPLRFEVNLYRMDFDNYIALTERGDVWWLDEDTDTSGFAADEASAPAGADEILPVFNFVQQDATFLGGEFSIHAQLFETAGFRVSGDAAMDVVRASFDGGGRPPRIPPQTLTLGVEAENANWTGRVEIVDTSAQKRIAAFETPTEGFTFVNAGLAWRPMGEDSAWTLRLDGRNLTDEEGRVHASFLKDELPLPGRNFRLTLLTRF